MPQRMVFGESLSDKFEIKAEAGQHRAQGNQLGLWLVPLTALVAWSSEELSHLGRDGQIDIGSVDGKKTKRILPK
jgi:hypothetical protein